MALLALGGGLALVRGGLDQPRLDPELAQPQALVGLEGDGGPGQQVVAAAPGVLQQVAGELLLERALVALESGAVLAGEVDGVLVGDVDAGDPAVLWASISLASLRASSTGCTSELKARLNTPSTRPSIRLSRLRRTLIGKS